MVTPEPTDIEEAGGTSRSAEEGSPRILVVDDDRGIRQALELLLQQSGYRVETAEEAASGLAVVRRGTDLVVSDIVMPGMSGVEFLREIRDTNPALPVILITAYPSAQSRRDARQLGISGWILKPFRPDAILTPIRFILPGTVPPSGVGPSREARRDPRYPVELRVTARPTDSPSLAPLWGTARDLSAGGLLVFLPELLPTQTPLSLQMRSRHGVILVHASVAWSVAERPGAPSSRHGLAFRSTGGAFPIGAFLDPAPEPPASS